MFVLAFSLSGCAIIELPFALALSPIAAGVQAASSIADTLSTHDEVATHEDRFKELFEQELELKEDVFFASLALEGDFSSCLVPPGFCLGIPESIEEFKSNPKFWDPTNNSPKIHGIILKGTKLHVTRIIGKTRFKTRLAYAVTAQIDSGEWKDTLIDINHLLSPHNTTASFLGINKDFTGTKPCSVECSPLEQGH